MSNIIIDSKIAKTITTAAGQVKFSACIATAFCRSESFLKNIPRISEDCPEKFIVVRWQARDLLSGASDLDLYHAAKSRGWQLYLNFSLHAKAFLFDDIAVIGSANLTERGMSGSNSFGNIELATMSQETKTLATWFDRLRAQSCLVDNYLFKAIQADIASMANGSIEAVLNQKSFSARTMSLVAKSSLARIYTNDLLWSLTPNTVLHFSEISAPDRNVEHDLKVLSLNAPVTPDAIRQAFFESASFQWLCETVDSEMSFGSLTQALHKALLDDPTPYRKEVKSLLANLLEWTATLAPQVFEIYRPNRSQRIRRIQADANP